MTERNYKKLEIEEFGTKLLESNDLDPVYVALYNMHTAGNFDLPQLCRWLLAYILCYHVGASCWFSEQDDKAFYAALLKAARNQEEAPVGGRWPRSHERRHWRGQFAEDVVNQLAQRYSSPENFILTIASSVGSSRPDSIPFSEISQRVQDHHGFGGWATFKLADLIDRLGLAPVDFAYEDVVIYRDPVLAAQRLFRERNDLPENAEVKPNAVRDVFYYLIGHFDNHSAPPLHDRAVGVQEVETVLCKWKSHMNGRYPLYNDIDEINEGLVPWAKISPTAQLFRNKAPQNPMKVAV